MAAAPPFVSYSSCTEAALSPGDWNLVYPSLQTLKGHVQEYPGCQGFDVFVRAEEDRMVLHCYTTWDTPEQLEVFLDAGYTVERMLADVGGLEAERTVVMEKVF
jgi:hypothetical protein